mgnify:CR=1 FL=1
MMYKNVAISGLPGTGSTTLLRTLEKELGGWQAFSGGEFMRAYALEKKLFKPNQGLHHDSRHYEEDFDRKVDFGMREAVETKQHQILESWLAGFMSQGIPGVLKVLLTCEKSLRIDRIVNRDSIPVEEAKKNILEREEANLTKWSRMYQTQWKEWVVDRGVLPEEAQIDFWHPNLYDLVIDTYSNSKEDTASLVLSKVAKL